jgi:uncharacterized iron-regulated membrane protein
MRRRLGMRISVRIPKPCAKLEFHREKPVTPYQRFSPLSSPGTMNLTYRGLWRWHFHAGMLCIPFVIILAITGAIYVFKPQIDAFADRAVDSLAVTGNRATGEQHIAAALASLPGSRLFVYEVPRERDDAVRVHIYAPDGAGRIVYVHPETLAILKTVPHTARLTEIVRMIHANLMAGRTGALLLELAASWAIVMLITGLYLWWPRDARGLAGAAYPRLGRGSRVFWRDLHAVTGVWISTLALFLLITALPWTTVAGNAILNARAWVAPPTHEWNLGGRSAQDEHAGHRAAAAAAAAAIPTPLGVDQVIARIARYHLEPPVRLYLPNDRTPHWRVRSETQNRPKVRELALDRVTGELIHDDRFADKSPLDKVINVGIAAHEGQLFGLPNQLLGFFTALGLLTVSVSAIAMWWRRLGGSLGIPAPRIAEFRIPTSLKLGIVVLGLLVPMLGTSLVVLWLIDLATHRRQKRKT